MDRTLRSGDQPDELPVERNNATFPDRTDY